MLRGPQTVGEVKGRTERLHTFASLDDVTATLDALAARDDPLVQRLGREPGRKEPRYAHLLGSSGASVAPGVPAADPVAPRGAGPAPAGDASGIDALRQELAALRAEVGELRDRVDQLGL
jgi:uncharacterized protein YceH (UPF0502 family)